MMGGNGLQVLLYRINVSRSRKMGINLSIADKDRALACGTMTGRELPSPWLSPFVAHVPCALTCQPSAAGYTA
jgi:hypothetical protein